MKLILRDTLRLDFFLSTKAVLMSPLTVTGTAHLVEGNSLDDHFAPSILQAIEIYTAPQIPAEFSMPVFQAGGTYGMPCKVIVLWTRR